MNILIEDEFKWLDLDNKRQTIINNVIQNALYLNDISTNVEISITLTDNETIKQINKQYRDIDKETDVLSFPQIDWYESEYEINYPGNDIENTLLGDIIISIQKLEAQAVEYGHSIERELGFLVAHSMLHLLGYDHLSKEDEEEMIEKQEEILKGLGLER